MTTGTNLLAAGLLLVFTACAKSDRSGTESVTIPQSAVRDQGRIGFCWAYTAVALVESNLRRQKGFVLDLSEESLGFLVMAARLEELANDMLAGRMGEDRAGILLRSDEVLQSAQLSDGLDLMERFGIVPEYVWMEKFKDEKSLDTAMFRVKQRLFDLVRSLKRRGRSSASPEDVATVLAPAIIDRMPPPSFVYRGTRYSPQSFAREYLAVAQGRYESLDVDTREGLLAALGRTKRALAAEFSVPLGISIDLNRTYINSFGPPKGSSLVEELSPLSRLSLATEIASHVPQPFEPSFRHALLVTDFVNEGGTRGEISDLEAAVAEDPMALEYLYAKNSWGKGGPGNPVATGYYRVSRDYLLDSIAAGYKVHFVLPTAVR